MACMILEPMSGFEPLSQTTAPRYLKIVRVSSFCSFTLISLWMPLALFFISLVFSAFIPILYLVQVLPLAVSSTAYTQTITINLVNKEALNCTSVNLSLPEGCWVNCHLSTRLTGDQVLLYLAAG